MSQQDQTPDFFPASTGSSPDFIPYSPAAAAQGQQPQQSWLMSHPYISALVGAAKQAGSAMFGGGPQQAAVPQPSDQDITNPNLNPFSYGKPSLSNAVTNSIPDAKALNPIAPALNNPNTAEGLGQSAVNLLMLRQMLSGRIPVRSLPEVAPAAGDASAEVVGSLNPRPIAQQPVAAAGSTSGTYMRDPRTNADILQDLVNRLGVGQGKVSMGVNAQPAQPPELPAGAYGKNAVKSNLAKNQRQMASANPAMPTDTFQRPPEIMDILNKEGGLTDADMATLQRFDFRNNRWKPGQEPAVTQHTGDNILDLLKQSIVQAQARR